MTLGDVGATLASLWGHFQVALPKIVAAFWCHFGVGLKKIGNALGSLWIFENDFP